MKRIVAIICTILTIVFVFLILNNHIDWFDSSIYQSIIRLKKPTVTDIFIIISNVIFVLITICILFWLFFKNKKISFLVTLNLGLSFLFSYLLKEIFMRARPIGIALVTEHGYSMPSSHAMVSISFFGFLFYYLYKNYPKGTLKTVLLCFLLFYILMIGISRIYLGVHYASDVLLGFTFGLLYLIGFVKVFRKDIVLEDAVSS